MGAYCPVPCGMTPPRSRLRLTGDPLCPEWMLVPRALSTALAATGVWGHVPEGGTLVVGHVDYTISPVIMTNAQPGDHWGHLRITAWGEICRPEQPVLRLAIGSILYGWHNAAALHGWSILPPAGVEQDSRLGDVELTGGITYLPGFFTDMPVELAQDALLGTGAPAGLSDGLF